MGDLAGGGKVGVDDHVQADLPLEHLSIAAIVGVADTSHRVACAQLLGDEAAHQIRLIVVGDSNHQIGVSCACVDEDGDGCAVALHTHDVQRAFAAAQGGGAAVHDGDVVSLLREGLGNGKANFTVANNNNFHNVLLFQRIGREKFAPITCIVYHTRRENKRVFLTKGVKRCIFREITTKYRKMFLCEI